MKTPFDRIPRLRRSRALLGVILGLALTGSASAAAPTVTSSGTSIGIHATSLQISGTGFDPIPANNTVSFNNGAVGAVSSASTTSLNITFSTAPTATGVLAAVVTTNGQSSGAAVQVATVEPLVQFAGASGTVNAATGTLSIPVTVTGQPTFAGGYSDFSTYASGFALPQYFAFDSSGNLYVSDIGAGTVSKITPGGVVSTVLSGLSAPVGLAFDSAGNLYAASQGQNSNGLVTMMTPGGATTTFASGFNAPTGITFDAAGNLYVANSGSNSISKVTPTGAVSSLNLTLLSPQALVFDASGNLYVSTAGDSSVSKVTPGGTVTVVASQLGRPTGLAVDPAGNLYICHNENYFGGNSYGSVTIVNSAGVVSTPASLSTPLYGLAIDAGGNLYAGTTASPATVVKIVPAMLAYFNFSGTAVSGVDYTVTSASPLTIASGQATASITGTLLPDCGTTPSLTCTLNSSYGAVLNSPSTDTLTINEPPPSVMPGSTPVAIDATTIVINGAFNPVAANNTVIFNDGAVGTVTSATGTSLTVSLTTPPQNLGALTATVTSLGVSTGAPVQVASVVPGVTESTSPLGLNATMLTISGAGFDPIAARDSVQFSNDVVGIVTAATSTQLTVNLSQLPAITGSLTAVVTADGVSSGTPVEVAVVEPIAQFNVTKETINESTGTFSIAVTLTGNPTFASGVSPTTFQVNTNSVNPNGMAFDGAGNFYFSNAAAGTISEVIPGGSSTTFASGLSAPEGLAFDAAGNLYVANNGNGTVSRITPAGAVSIFTSELHSPSALAFDAAGNLYVANGGDNTVSVVTPGGSANTFASGFSNPNALAFDSNGNLYVSNESNGVISEVTSSGVVSTFASGLGNPAGLVFDTSGNLYVSFIAPLLNLVEPLGTITIGGGSLPPLGAISVVSPSGTVNGFVSSIYSPSALAFDGFGNLFVSQVDYNYDGEVAVFSPTALVPFELGGTAASGVDYSGLTVTPL